jgi:hypothetical protein
MPDRFLQQAAKVLAVKNIIAQDQTNRLFSDKRFAEDERLSQSVRRSCT